METTDVDVGERARIVKIGDVPSVNSHQFSRDGGDYITYCGMSIPFWALLPTPPEVATP